MEAAGIDNKENIDSNKVTVEVTDVKVVDDFNEKDINITVDLVDAARKQLLFLREVDKHPNLYQGKCLMGNICFITHYEVI